MQKKMIQHKFQQIVSKKGGYKGQIKEIYISSIKPNHSYMIHGGIVSSIYN